MFRERFQLLVVFSFHRVHHRASPRTSGRDHDPHPRRSGGHEATTARESRKPAAYLHGGASHGSRRVTRKITLVRDQTVTRGVTKRDRCDHGERAHEEVEEGITLSPSLSVRLSVAPCSVSGSRRMVVTLALCAARRDARACRTYRLRGDRPARSRLPATSRSWRASPRSRSPR